MLHIKVLFLCKKYLYEFSIMSDMEVAETFSHIYVHICVLCLLFLCYASAIYTRNAVSYTHLDVYKRQVLSAYSKYKFLI